MAEHESAVAFGEHVGVNQFVDRREQLRRGPVEHGCYIVEGKPPSQCGSDRRHLTSQVGHSLQPQAHAVTHTMRESPLDQLGPTLFDADESLFAQS